MRGQRWKAIARTEAEKTWTVDCSYRHECRKKSGVPLKTLSSAENCRKDLSYALPEKTVGRDQLIYAVPGAKGRPSMDPKKIAHYYPSGEGGPGLPAA